MLKSQVFQSAVSCVMGKLMNQYVWLAPINRLLLRLILSSSFLTASFVIGIASHGWAIPASNHAPEESSSQENGPSQIELQDIWNRLAQVPASTPFVPTTPHPRPVRGVIRVPSMAASPAPVAQPPDLLRVPVAPLPPVGSAQQSGSQPSMSSIQGEDRLIRQTSQGTALPSSARVPGVPGAIASSTGSTAYHPGQTTAPTSATPQRSAALPQATPGLLQPSSTPGQTPAVPGGVRSAQPVQVQWGGQVTAQSLPPAPPLPAAAPTYREEVFEAPVYIPTVPPVTSDPAQPYSGVSPYPTVPPGTAYPSPLGVPAPVVPPNSSLPPLAQPPIPTTAVTPPSLTLQGAAIYLADDFSARARLSAVYPLSPRVVAGGSLDFIVGDEEITDLGDEGVNINELYVAVAPESLPSLRFVVGQVDLTSYFDRNSFAKDGVSQFFNDIFQTNPALAAANIDSRPGVVVNWSLNDNIEARAAGFSSAESIGDFQLDGFAGELGFRVGNAILRGTYVSSRDTDISGDFESDRLESFGLNGEVFVPELGLGLFARYGQLVSQAEDFEADTYSFGFNLIDLLMQNDRLGVAYGRNLSDEINRDRNNPVPDALEFFYDFPVLPNLRLGFTLQQVDDFSETIAGLRIRTDFDITPRSR